MSNALLETCKAPAFLMYGSALVQDAHSGRSQYEPLIGLCGVLHEAPRETIRDKINKVTDQDVVTACGWADHLPPHHTLVSVELQQFDRMQILSRDSARLPY